MSDIIEVKKAA